MAQKIDFPKRILISFKIFDNFIDLAHYAPSKITKIARLDRGGLSKNAKNKCKRVGEKLNKQKTA